MYFQKDVIIMGYARSKKTDEELRQLIQKSAGTKMDMTKKNPEQKRIIEMFLSRCFYTRGDSYGSEPAWKEVHRKLTDLEQQVVSEVKQPARNRIFYFALPPTAYEEACGGVRAQAMSSKGWNRVVIEKPFGKDLKSSDQLAAIVKSHFAEEQVSLSLR